MLVAFSNPSAAELGEDSIGKNGVAAWSWSFYDPQANNVVEKFDLSRMQDTGVPLVPGQTYEVEISVHPQASEWDFVIAGRSLRYDSRAALGRSIRFRSGASEAGGVLHFNLRHTQPDAENRIHLDEIEIDALPDALSAQSLSDRNH